MNKKLYPKSKKQLYAKRVNEGDYEIDNRDSRTTELHFKVRGIKVLLRLDPVEIFVDMIENRPEPYPNPFEGRSPRVTLSEIVDDLCYIEVLDVDDPIVTKYIPDLFSEDSE